ncbi:alpha-galactosidase [Microbacterium sp. H83]|uniref:alpha-galactosidase n=1 Tax=Microbacterium sp. H83 TaxID=1827324 RepID=UPI0007F45F3A|nr:alpha-galactosidase [Microbacterium sp. H83]OAN41394.1 alpha-galactosidase [Microbacterium sp. H83]
MHDSLIHLSSAGVSLLLDVSGDDLPAIVHWGAALGSLSEDDARMLALAAVEPVVPNAGDVPIRVALLPEGWRGWTGKPGVEGHRDGADWSPRFRTERVTLGGSDLVVTFTEADAGTVVVESEDATAGLHLVTEIELTGSGVVRARATLRNTADDHYDVAALNIAFPLPPNAREILDFAGRWGKERTPQRSALVVGIHEREGRKGRTGADAATVLSVGVPGFGFGAGEVWGVHVGFSGNHRAYAERLFSGVQVIGGGELLLPGEIRLATGEEYSGPWVYGVWGDGLDEQAARIHRMLRARPRHPRRPRPVTLNVWEAVYFDHDRQRLWDLADRAEALGVERFVLDDGWFRGRRDDTAGLGDWFVDEEVWPDGLRPLAEHVRDRGMEFGIWFEPEMVSPDSDLAREHPEWILATGGRMPVLARNQLVLDIARDDAYAFVLERIREVLRETAASYIKWDHNRDLVDPGHGPRGVPGVHGQTLAAYRMMAELKELFPELEIESCSSGGARVDLGVIEHTDRVWVSDCIDPLERQQMNRWTAQLLPPELLGSHVASGVSHSTGRSHTLAFRAATALHGHFGIEWDLAAATPDELHELGEWIALYKESRALMHTGEMVRIDTSDPTLHLYGSVSEERDSALFVLASIGRSEVSPLGRFALRGLDPDARYRVRPVLPGGAPRGLIRPPWFGADDRGVELTGRALATAGLHTPSMHPESAIVLDVSAVR